MSAVSAAQARLPRPAAAARPARPARPSGAESSARQGARRARTAPRPRAPSPPRRSPRTCPPARVRRKNAPAGAANGPNGTAPPARPPPPSTAAAPAGNPCGAEERHGRDGQRGPQRRGPAGPAPRLWRRRNREEWRAPRRGAAGACSLRADAHLALALHAAAEALLVPLPPHAPALLPSAARALHTCHLPTAPAGAVTRSAAGGRAANAQAGYKRLPPGQARARAGLRPPRTGRAASAKT